MFLLEPELERRIEGVAVGQETAKAASISVTWFETGGKVGGTILPGEG